MRFSGSFIIVLVLFITVLITSNIIAVKPITILRFSGSVVRR